MTRYLFVALLLVAGAGFAAAQMTTSTTDVLGAHLNYGRGCAACHAPHSGSNGNGAAKGGDSTSGNTILWGEDATGLYGKTITTGGGKFVEVLPATMSATTPDVNGMLTCLTCHDGNYASGAMMKNRLYENLPASYGTSNTVPTLIGSNSGGSRTYLNEHPVGLSARLSCGSSNWDCTVSSSGTIRMTGRYSSQFVSNYDQIDWGKGKKAK